MNQWLAGVIFGGIGLVVGACWADKNGEDERNELRDELSYRLKRMDGIIWN